MSEHAPETTPRALLLTLIALLLLGALSLALRFAHLGSAGYPVALGIAVIKAALVAVFFMEVLREKPTVWFAGATGLALLAVMLTLVLADVLTRAVPALPNPPTTAPRDRG